MDSLPSELQFHNVSSKKKTILEKQQRQVLPTNGTQQTANFGSGPQIVFRIPIDDDWSIDFNSGVIVADLQVGGLDATTVLAANVDRLKTGYFVSPAATAGAGNTQYAPIPILTYPESFESFFNRVAIYLNGSELERIDNYSTLETFCGHWMNNATWANLMSGSMGLNTSILERCRQLLIGSATVNANNVSNTLQIAIPLRFLGLTNIKSLLPAYLLGPNSLEIRIWMEPASNCFSQGLLNVSQTESPHFAQWVPSTAQTMSYTLSNIRMNINYIQTEPSYKNALSQYLISNNLQIPVQTWFVTQFPVPVGSAGWITNNISVQYSDINAIFCIFTRNTETGPAYLATDRMHPIEGLSQAKLTINGRVLPSVNVLLPAPGYVNTPNSVANKSQVLIVPSSTQTAGQAGQNPSVNSTYANQYNISGINGQCGAMAGEALNYLLKALGCQSSCEMIGQVNTPKINTTSVICAGSGGLLSTASVLSTQTGAGFFYNSNKAVYNCMFKSTAQGANTAVDTSVSGFNPLVNEEIFWKTPSLFALGWNLSRSDYSDDYELAGYNASSNSGIVQIGLNFGGITCPNTSVTASTSYAASASQAIYPMDNYTCWVFIQHTRILDIGKENAQVLY